MIVNCLGQNFFIHCKGLILSGQCTTVVQPVTDVCNSCSRRVTSHPRCWVLFHSESYQNDAVHSKASCSTLSVELYQQTLVSKTNVNTFPLPHCWSERERDGFCHLLNVNMFVHQCPRDPCFSRGVVSAFIFQSWWRQQNCLDDSGGLYRPFLLAAQVSNGTESIVWL